MSKRVNLIIGLMESYPNNKATEATIANYVRLLQDIPLADLQTSIDQCMATCKFLPTIAEIREQWRGLTMALSQQTASDAWGDVQREILQTGYIGTPKFDNPVTAIVVRNMGWHNICASDKPGVDRRQFMDMYEQYMARNESFSKLLPEAREFAEQRQPGLRALGDSVRAALPEWKVGED